ncbi:MAG TPA: GNAT family N-acetyltransferase [Micropepsaceae bacterium]|nr:GNAT family N-acetyltransferase [Micropepsaceae bacterium]
MNSVFRTHTTREDAEAVEQLVRQTGVFSVTEIAIARELVEENLAKGDEASGYHFLIEDNGRGGIAGYTCYGPISGTEARYELYWIAVGAESRGSGLAQRLLRATEETVKGLGGPWLFAETSTRADYAPARKFYTGNGYRLLAEIPEWHADGDGLAVFGKKLR